jgi:predicted O-linked N-acetylglucosamine transferase (SPINDLY family)
MLLGVSDDPADHARCVRSFACAEVPVVREPIYDRGIVRDGRLRIAFLSPDFRRHAAGISFVEMFERMDRTRFDLTGISLGPDDHSDLRTRFVKVFEQFHDVQGKGDEQVAHLIKDLRVDIAVELTPHTEGARPGILAFRPAPIQVNLLHGGVGSGASFIDYIIGDRIALPFDQQPYFLEQIVQLPDGHSAHDSTQAISSQAPSRSQAGLPEQGLVFCCFNNTWKLNAGMFEIWMKLLGQIQGSVLWLSDNNPDAKANLRVAASRHGIDPDRLVFAPKIPSLADHLARHRLADLFLDTLPANAQTTALDALWAGLPVLTCLGRSFAGRVAASQLLALGMPELVTERLEDYEAEALRLARDPGHLQAIRHKVAQNRLTTPLFDTGRLVRHLETAFATMWDIWTRGETPRGFRVEPAIGIP